MNLRNLILTAFFCIITLFGCAKTENPQINKDFLQEDWMQTINLHPMIWTRDADRWFFTGEPTATENYVNHAPIDSAISLMTVKTAQFTNVNIHGCFQVQIVGAQTNSVVIMGPNESVRQILVRVSGNTLMLTQPQDDKGQMANLRNVIVRIGVCNLRQLDVSGAVKVEGRYLFSNGMIITANNNDSILLTGNINLQKINNDGAGTISMMNISSPCIKIVVRGSGTVNINGRVGIQSIENLGSGKVNIIGANSRSLVIKAAGSSKTNVAGYANLKRLDASGNACVHLYWVKGINTQVNLNGNAQVGLAGTTDTLNLLLMDNARFGGQYLHANNIYIQTSNNSHANISGSRKIFASAADNSSIYYFGSPNIASKNTTDHGSIISVWTESTALPTPSYAPQFVTSINRP